MDAPGLIFLREPINPGVYHRFPSDRVNSGSAQKRTKVKIERAVFVSSKARVTLKSNYEDTMVLSNVNYSRVNSFLLEYNPTTRLTAADMAMNTGWVVR